MQDKMFTVNQVAERFEVAPESVRRWVRRGELTCVWAGSRMRFTEAQIRSFLARHSTKLRRAS